MGDTANSVNPLKGYFRQPKIFIRLPSQGKFYKPGSIDISQTNEYAVYSMTAKDELMLKTPDALVSGQATVSVIESCIPAILNAWEMPSIDVDAALIAIRIATYGEKMEVGASCPSCNEFSKYDFDLVRYLEQSTNFDFKESIQHGELIIKIRPYCYKEMTATNLKALEQQKIISILNDDTIDEQEKLLKFNQSFETLTSMTVDLIAGSIGSVTTPETEVTDPDMIKEFIQNAPKDVFDAVSVRVSELKNDLDVKSQDVKCAECEHEYPISLSLDQSNFFAVRS